MEYNLRWLRDVVRVETGKDLTEEDLDAVVRSLGYESTELFHGRTDVRVKAVVINVSSKGFALNTTPHDTSQLSVQETADVWADRAAQEGTTVPFNADSTGLPSPTLPECQSRPRRNGKTTAARKASENDPPKDGPSSSSTE